MRFTSPHMAALVGNPSVIILRSDKKICGKLQHPSRMGELRALPNPAKGSSQAPVLTFKVDNTNEIHHQDIVMARERTLSIIKPDAVAKNIIGQVLTRFENAGMRVVACRMTMLSRAEAEGFYAVHKARPFFKDLVDFMISGPVVIQVLEGDDAIQKNRDLMGATDPKKADAGTIRADFADSIDANAVHGSDAPETAATEIAYFFAALDIYSR